MNRRRTGITVFLGVILLLFVGCASRHEHQIVTYIAIYPTCEECGIAENTCSACGYKFFTEIAAMGHEYKDGICVRCGDIESNPSLEPPVESQFYSLEDIYEESKRLSYTLSEEDFYRHTDNTEFTEIYLNKNGRLKLEADGILADIGEIRVDVPFESAAVLSTIVKAVVKEGYLTLIDVLGTTQTFGAIYELRPFENNTIVGFLINMQGELLLRYSSGEVVKAGLISYENSDTTADLLLFRREEDRYILAGALDKNIEILSVPIAHKGKVIERIATDAFRGCKMLKTAIMPQTLKYISGYAFADCERLESIVLPAQCYINVSAFLNCTALDIVYFLGTESDWKNIDIENGNGELLSADLYFYSENRPSENQQNYWHFVEGIPCVWQ